MARGSVVEEESWKKEGRIGKNGERRIIRVGNRVHNKQVVELGAAVDLERGKKRAGMEEGIEQKGGRRLREGERDFPDIHHAITKTSSRWWFPPRGITRLGC